jgi:hypothetical protein
MSLIRQRFIALTQALEGETWLTPTGRIALQVRKIVEGVAYGALNGAEHRNQQTLSQQLKDADPLLGWLTGKKLIHKIFPLAIGVAFVFSTVPMEYGRANSNPVPHSSNDVSVVLFKSSPMYSSTIPSISVSSFAKYKLNRASDFGAKCDGVTDDTAALQKAFNLITSHQALQLPAGTCVISSQLNLHGKNHVAVVGAGKDRTIIQAADPFHSVFVVSNANNVLLKAFQIYSPNSTTRSTDAKSRGFYVEKSSGVTLDGVEVRQTAGAGILFYVVTDSMIVNSEVVNNRSDAFHVTGASRNILVRYNRAKGSGDDCFASIGYGTKLNRDIRFLDNDCSDNRASGVSFEGTIGGQAYRNKLTRTGVSGIRIASQRGYNTGPVSNIDLKDNILTEVKTRADVDHAAVMVFSSLASVQNISFENTIVTNPHTSIGMRFLNYVTGKATVSNISVRHSRTTSTDNRIEQCFSVSSGVTRVTLAENTLNVAPCDTHHD